MCGITGAIWSDPELAIEPPVLQRMTEVLRHRGPDDAGSYRSEIRYQPPYETVPGVALGFRRLSIIDVGGGHQPLANEDGSIWVVFNGEIYNFLALRHRLEGSGHRFRTRSDTETIVHLYEDEGLDCFRHLNGMFAVAIWDRPRRRLVLARDRLGKKPLVFLHQPGRLAFGSELKSLLEIPGVARDVDVTALDHYLTFQYVPHPRTIFRGISKLSPGHLAVYADDQLQVRPYWQPDLQRQCAISERDACEQLRELLESSVAMRLQSDVPLGAFLSGGIDSSLIVAIAQRATQQPMKTFSIGFPVKQYDETHYARRVAEHLKTEHHEFQVTPAGMEILPSLVWHYDEPFADSSAIPTWYVSQRTREHVTVALSGDGGDELFAGYPRYKAVALAARLDRWWPLRSVFGARIWQSLPSPTRQKSVLRRFKRFCEVLRTPPVRRYLDWIGIFQEAQRAQLYTDQLLSVLTDDDPVGFLEQAYARCNRRDPVTAFSLTDLTTYLPCDLMTKVDIASMAHSLECRQPFLDYRLVEFAASLPSHLKYRWGRGKRLLRAAFGHLLPDEIWSRSKMGFGVPLEDWFRHELKELTHDVLLGSASVQRGYFRPEFVRQMVQQHEAGIANYSYPLWSLLVLELWLQRWCDGRSSTAPLYRLQ
jgi:asparagine synthase (glutamine-hydrolysing)